MVTLYKLNKINNCKMSYKSTKIIFLLTEILLVAGSIDIIDTGCHNDADCKEFVKMENILNTTCVNDHCLCMDSDLKKVDCLPQKMGLSNVIGGKCPCSDIKNSSCINGLCACNHEYRAAVDNRKCLPKRVTIGSPCEYNAQCSKQTIFAECNNHTCSCRGEFAYHNGTCQSVIDRKKCESDNNCSVLSHLLCISSDQCICKPGFVLKFDKTACLPNADYNDGCLESVQCQKKLGEGAVCENGKCICGEDFVKVSFVTANQTKSLCENHIAIGQVCSYDTDCFYSHYNGTEQSMNCVGRECKCADDYEADRYGRFCVQSITLEQENTWFDSILMKVSSTFASSSRSHSNSLNYLIAVVFICALILFS